MSLFPTPPDPSQRICAIPIRTLQGIQDLDQANRRIHSLLRQRGFDISKPHTMNRDIASQYKDKFGDTVEVSCPSGQQVKAGATFDCSIKDKSQKIQIKVTSDSGDYTWKTTG